MSIWIHKEINEMITPETRLITLYEGNTREIELKDGKTKLILKREDNNPTGSWKDRGSAYKMTKLISRGIYEAVIASSGNAAISLMTYANSIGNFKMHIVISNKTSVEKQNIIISLARDYHQIYKVEQMRIKAVELASELKIPNLKVSVDDEVLPGYWSLGLELAKNFTKQDNKNNAIIIAASSGTTLVGMIQGLHIALGSELNMPKIFVVQTQKVHPIVSELHPEVEQIDHSISDAIVDSKALRSPQILKIISETQGDALSISDEEILLAKEFLNNKNVTDVSYTSLLSVARYIRLITNSNFEKIICILAGR